MDRYNVQFIILAILLISISFYNLFRLSSNKYPEVFIDFLFHGTIIFIGLFAFYYFYIVNMIKEGTNREFSGDNVNISPEGVELVRSYFGENKIDQFVIKLENVENSNEKDPLPEVEDINKGIFNRALITCAVFFMLCVVFTIIAKNLNYDVSITHIILMNIFLFFATLSADFMMLQVVKYFEIMPLSPTEIAKATYDRLKYNFNKM